MESQGEIASGIVLLLKPKLRICNLKCCIPKENRKNNIEEVNLNRRYLDSDPEMPGKGPSLGRTAGKMNLILVEA
jgi:hypothetical protein